MQGKRTFKRFAEGLRAGVKQLVAVARMCNAQDMVRCHLQRLQSDCSHSSMIRSVMVAETLRHVDSKSDWLLCMRRRRACFCCCRVRWSADSAFFWAAGSNTSAIPGFWMKIAREVRLCSERHALAGEAL